MGGAGRRQGSGVLSIPGSGFNGSGGGIRLSVKVEEETVEQERYRLAGGPDGAQRHLERGNRLVSVGRFLEARGAFRAALAFAPGDAEIQTNLGNVLMALGSLDEAVEAYRAALAGGFDHPLVHYNLGVALRKLGCSEAALTAFQAASERAPDLAPVHNNRGNALRDLGRYDEAASAYLEALALRPGDGGTGVNLSSALSLLHERDAAAATALARRWRDQAPDDAMARHVAAAMTGEASPDRAEDGYVRQLFDGFAADFEQRLADLDYQAPALVAACLNRLWPQPSGRLEVLDAGCGTGLCAPALRRHARTLWGVDLSFEMLERADARRLYDELEVVELTAFLIEHPEHFDLIVAADVFCYFGDLVPVLTAAAAALRPGGRLVFTVERDTGNGMAAFTLQANGRYRHAPSAVSAVLAALGLEGPAAAAVTLRRENDAAVAGLFIEVVKA